MAEIQVAIDRFSELPLEIAHHILSFLPIADVTRVSSLSKRCSRLRLSNPTVNFHSFPSESTLTFQKRLKLWNSLDRFLMPTVGNLHGNNTDFPSSMFLCESLRFIKDLRLEQVYGLEDITIESSSLESFSVRFPCYFDIDRLAISGDRIKDIDIDWDYDPTRNNNTSVLYISAPNLKYLTWYGNILNHQHLGEMHRLEQVEISLSSYHVNDLDRVCEQLLHSISSVKYLRLDQVTAKIVFREGFTPAPLGNVCNLRMWIWCNIDDKLVAAMTSLFRAVPNLTTLSVSSYPEYPFLGGGTNLSGFDKGYWELQRFDFVRNLEQFLRSISSVKVLLDQVTAMVKRHYLVLNRSFAIVNL
ncbi:PREDICTED: uncharacterized protein LOC101303261 [Fragaria vesca subsp. vesca]